MKLSDTQLILLGEAARQENHALVLPDRLNSEAARKKTVQPLLDKDLVTEVAASGGLPVWRRNDDGVPLALVITDAGLKAIHVEAEDKPAAAAVITANIPPPAASESKRRSGKANARKATAQPRRHQQTESPARAVSKPANARSGDRSHSGSKQDQVLAMLRSKSGTTLAAIMEATSWQPHSVRGFFSGVVRRKLKLALTSEGKGERRVYRIAATPVTTATGSGAKRRVRT
jgi:hypothetical protein